MVVVTVLSPPCPLFLRSVLPCHISHVVGDDDASANVLHGKKPTMVVVVVQGPQTVICTVHRFFVR